MECLFLPRNFSRREKRVEREVKQEPKQDEDAKPVELAVT
jgi:hypothetical protein